MTTVEAQPDAAPVAVIGVTCDGLTCQFDGSASTDGSGSPVAYAWTFGDGTTAEGASVQHTYNDGGSFTVELTVTDDEGGSASDAVSLSVAAATDAVAFVDASSENTNSTTIATTIHKELLLATACSWCTPGTGPTSSTPLRRDGPRSLVSRTAT